MADRMKGRPATGSTWWRVSVESPRRASIKGKVRPPVHVAQELERIFHRLHCDDCREGAPVTGPDAYSLEIVVDDHSHVEITGTARPTDVMAKDLEEMFHAMWCRKCMVERRGRH